MTAVIDRRCEGIHIKNTVSTKSSVSRLTLGWIFCLFSIHTALGQSSTNQFFHEQRNGNRDNYVGVIGGSFRTGSSNVMVSHVGYYMTNAAGLHRTHHVGIFASNGSGLLGSALVPAGAGTLVTNGYSWVALNPPLLLSSGTLYVVATEVFANDGDVWPDQTTYTNWNSYFVGTNTWGSGGTNNYLCYYSPSGAAWPTFPATSFGPGTMYGSMNMALLPVGAPVVLTATTQVSTSSGVGVTITTCENGQYPLMNQWYKAPSTLLAGQTNAILTLSNPQLSDSGTYYLAVSNALGGVLSSNVMVTVVVASGTNPPSVLQQPQSQSAWLNQSAQFSVGASGTLPLSYQWQFNGANLTSATNATLTLAGVTGANQGSYFVVVSNAFGYTNSATVSLTVNTNIAYVLVDPTMPVVTNFLGWGTSLAWWANLAGGYANRDDYASLAFTQLKLNIVRYNIGCTENPNIPDTIQIRAQIPGFEPSNGVWNWDADTNQRWMLRQAVALGANHVEASSYSPPWWMTVSGSVTGSTNGTSSNLQTNYENAFAVYLAMVVSNLTVNDGVTFKLVTPMNEPNSDWWVYGGAQPGCAIGAAQQSRVVVDLRSQLNALNLSAVGIDASEDYDPSITLSSLDGYSTAGLNDVSVISTHSYNPSGLVAMRNQAGAWQKPVWTAEYGDGDATGITMARRIHDDIAEMWAQAWVYWQVCDYAGWGCISNSLDGSGDTSYSLAEKFYVLGQFSQFISPGSQILNVGDSNSLAAYNSTSNSLVMVTVNDSANAYTAGFDLGGFSGLPAQATLYRTSPTENQHQLSVSLTNTTLVSLIPAGSVSTFVLNNATVAPPSSVALAWYPFEGNAVDASGHGNNGTIRGNVAFASDKVGALAAQFDGISGYVQIPCCISNDFTISFWLKTTATASTGQWWAGQGLVDGEVASGANDFGVSLVGANVALGVGNPDTTITSTEAVNDGNWHQVAATRDAVSGQMLIYVDGVLQASGLGPLGPKAASPSLRIGSIQAGYAGGFFAGAMDDVQIFGRVFSAAEIGQLMNYAPTITSAQTNFSILAGRTLTITNTATDAAVPAVNLTWNLPMAPAGAAIEANSGVFNWRPAMAQSPSTNLLVVTVTDNGSPSITVTQTQFVTVTQPEEPAMTGPSLAAGNFSATISGDSGPDYVVQATTNLNSTPNWVSIFTNATASPPFEFLDRPTTNFACKFYRVILQP